LKKSFRLKSKECHPDQGGTHEDFIKLKDAYDAIMSFNGDERIFILNGDNEKVGVTIDGVLLTSLGQGFDSPLINSTDCTNCKGQGYITNITPGCFECNDTGKIIMSRSPCHKCKGTGQHADRKGELFPCWRCNGTGMYNKLMECFSCFGKYSYKRKTHHTVCYHCEGRGQIQIFNPVLPKGRIFSEKKTAR